VEGMKVYNFKKILVSNMVISKEMSLTQGYELPLTVCQLLESVNVMEFHTVEAYYSWGLTRVKYGINKLSRVEKEWVIVRIKSCILTV